MDWKTLREEKLAKTASYRPTKFREGVWWRAAERISDIRARFMVLSWWEKGMVIGAGALVAVLTPMAAFALMGGDEGQPALFPTTTPIAIIADPGSTPTITPQATSTAKAVAPTPTPKAPNRKDCDEIRGTVYQSDDEQDWFKANCDEEPEPDDTATPEPVDTAPPVQQPTNTPQPEPSISASQAKTMAVGWIRGNLAFSELTVSSAGCNALPSGNSWLVGCTGTTPGCQAASCDTLIWVCISNGGSIRQC
ncbi:MAG: hypothetical protein IH865_05325 [Chloroflexi bacterium]|nr:hypothetical protein [Chloroflexota bacterium]